MAMAKTREKEYVAVAKTVDEVYELIRRELGNEYKVVEKDARYKYRFPFSWKKEYRYRAVLEEASKARSHKKSLLDQLQNNKGVQESECKHEKALKSFFNRLVQNEVETSYARELLEDAREQLKQSGVEGEDAAIAALQSAVVARLKVSGPIKGKQTQTLALIGPTGVGKTTTLVKIATTLKQSGKRVGLITTDNYRIAAFEQLKEYADTLGCPMIKSEPEELYEPIDVFKYQKGMDHILVDTSGRSPMNEGLIEEIKQYLDVVQPDHVALVLSSAQKYSDMVRTLDNYKEIKIDSLIFTKLDETKAFGFLYNVQRKYNLPVSYVTTGQEVPDDIETATKEALASRIINGAEEHESSC